MRSIQIITGKNSSLFLLPFEMEVFCHFFVKLFWAIQEALHTF